jgi:hypothetical protein
VASREDLLSRGQIVLLRSLRQTQASSKRDDRAVSVEFEAVGGSSDATYSVSYYVENYRDGLYTPSYPRHNGEKFTVSLRAGDAVMIERGKMNVISTTYGAPLGVQPTPEWPTIPKLGDVCEIVTPAIGDKPCWWVPPGHQAVAFAVWARGTSPDWLGGDTDYTIKNIDGLQASGSIRYGDEKALTLRPGDTLSLKGGLDFDFKHSLTAVAIAR